MRHRRDEGECGAFGCQNPQVVQKWSILGPSIRVKEGNSVRSLFSCGLHQDAPKWCDADSARKYDGRPYTIVVQPQVAERTFDLDVGAERKRLQDTLEGGVAHSRRDHERVFERRACDGEATRVAFGVRLGRIQQRNVDELSGFEGP